MVDQNFEIGGKKFKLRKIDAIKQFHIARRIAPLLSEILPVMGQISKVSKDAELSEEQRFDQFAKIAEPVFNGFSKLSDDDADRLLYSLLYAAEIQQEQGNWAKISNGSQLMFQDLDLPVLLQVAGRAFAYNLSGFFSALPRGS